MAEPTTFQLMVARYQDLTAPELLGFREATREIIDGGLHEADRIMQVCLDLEHFIAVLPLNPAEAGPKMVAELKELQSQTFDITKVFVRLNFFGERGPVENIKGESEGRSARGAANDPSNNVVPPFASSPDVKGS